MVSNSIRRVRCDDCLSIFVASSRGCILLTLTTPDVVDLVEIRGRWRVFRHSIVRALKIRDLKYIMNYEIHPHGHGWHIHSVFNSYIPSALLLRLSRLAGFGRIDFRRVNTKGVADYLVKHALKAYRGFTRAESRRLGLTIRARLVNCSRGLPVLSDYAWQSDFKCKVLLALRTLKMSPFFSRMSFSDLYYHSNCYVLLGCLTPSDYCLRLSSLWGETLVLES